MGINIEVAQCASIEEFKAWKDNKPQGRKGTRSSHDCELCGTNYMDILPRLYRWKGVCYKCAGQIPGWEWTQSWEGIQEHQEGHHNYWRKLVERTTPHVKYQGHPPCTPGRSVIR
jgi:hypothetical protein